jgi:hypothetical protein
VEGLDPEYIKETIRREDARYYLLRSKIPGAAYKKLYCRLPGWSTDKTRRVKVDILVPPSPLNLPTISASERCFIRNIPVMPIFDLLVMKTQGWREHRDSKRRDFRDKELNDVSDIIALLKRARFENVSFVEEADNSRHSQEFIGRARSLVNRFVRARGRIRQWRAIGFDV